MVLPEDLRSELLMAYGRDELSRYHRSLLTAVEVWRRLGVWRVRTDDDCYAPCRARHMAPIALTRDDAGAFLVKESVLRLIRQRRK